MNFVCPYCNHPTTITDPNRFDNWEHIRIEQSDKGDIGFNIIVITCPNSKCKKLYLKASLTSAYYEYSRWKQGKDLQNWQLLPESSAKVLPDYIPPAIKEDYYESCRISNLSPKASAALSRRCLQGMIRDFWKIKKDTLKKEVDELESKVDPLIWEAIDSVRSVGNIGAHMEKDIDLIIEVDSKEAKLLIELIEQLIDDWYVERHEKEHRLKNIKEMAEIKRKQKSGGDRNGK